MQVDFTHHVPPSEYRCARCAAHGVRLWRPCGGALHLICYNCVCDLEKLNPTNQHPEADPQQPLGNDPDADLWWKELPLRPMPLALFGIGRRHGGLLHVLAAEPIDHCRAPLPRFWGINPGTIGATGHVERDRVYSLCGARMDRPLDYVVLATEKYPSLPLVLPADPAVLCSRCVGNHLDAERRTRLRLQAHHQGVQPDWRPPVVRWALDTTTRVQLLRVPRSRYGGIIRIDRADLTTWTGFVPK